MATKVHNFTITITIVRHAVGSECIGNKLDFELCFDCQPFLNAAGLDDDDTGNGAGDGDGDDDNDRGGIPRRCTYCTYQEGH